VIKNDKGVENVYIEDLSKITESVILTKELFQEIYDIENDFDKMKVLIAVSDRAKVLGKKLEFEKLCRAYLKQKKALDLDIASQGLNEFSSDGMTHFNSEKYEDYRCGYWIAYENGIKEITSYGDRKACSHPILPIKILKNAETGFCKVVIAFKLKNHWSEITVDKEIISSSSKIVSLSKYGIRVTSENAKALVQFLSDVESLNEDRITNMVSTSKLGWIKGEFMPYGTSVVFDNEQSFKTVSESMKERGSRSKWYDLILDIRKTRRIESQISIVASLSSPIVEIVNGLPFILDIFGKTGRGKTVSLMLAASVWANPSDNEYITDPKSTVTALELRLDFLNNLPMLIDDMAQLKNKYDGDFSELVYFLCSGKGKDRANQNLGINKSTIWKNVMLVNSEHSMVTETMQGGAINRIIDIETQDGYIFEDGNKVVGILKENYGFCGKEFIEVLKEIGFDKIKQMQKDFTEKIVENAKNLGVEKEEKQIMPMSILLTADKIATDNLFKDGIYLDLDYCVSLLKSKGEVSEDDRAYEFIMSEVAININKFKPGDRGEYKGECWGAIENNYAIIMVNVFNSMAKRGNFSTTGFLSWAKEKNLLQLSNDGKSSKLKRIEGSPGRCIFLKLPSEIVKDSDGFIEISQEEQEKLPFE